MNYGFIDLHLHLDGSLSIDTVKQLAYMQQIELPKDEELIGLLQISGECEDLNEYLEKFDFPLSLLQTRDAISIACYNLVEELKSQGLIYAEIRFAPQLHLSNGLNQEEVVLAAIEGISKSDFRSNLILCLMRGDDNFDKNLETIQIADKYLNKGVCAIDLAGAEGIYPTDNFEKLFSYARELKIPATIHAGEAAGSESVVKALDFGAKRIGHGVRTLEDEKLLKRISEENITLELCPTSNLNTNIFQNIKEYPIRKFLECGIKITINTDNMTVSNTTLQAEFLKIKDELLLNDEDVWQIIKNASESTFADEATKEWLHKEILETYNYYKVNEPW